MKSKVLVIGAGGLGCPVMLYLAAAGAGSVGIVDDDVISITNLHRQVIYRMDDIGNSKAETAAFRLSQLNPGIRIKAYNTRISNQNAMDLIEDYDVVIDGTDNFSTRYMINDACVLLNKALVSGSVSKYEGQVMILNVPGSGDRRPVNYRDLFPNPPGGNEAPSCGEAGVLGTLTGIIGGMMAGETIKLIAGIGKPLINRLLTFNALNNSVYEFSLSPNFGASQGIPKNEAEFKAMDYEWFCASHSENPLEMDIDSFNEMLKKGDGTIIDIRESGETPKVSEFIHERIPFSKFRTEAGKIEGNKIVLFCQTGQRSLAAAEMLRAEFGSDRNIYSLRGGIQDWKRQKQLNHG